MKLAQKFLSLLLALTLVTGLLPMASLAAEPADRTPEVTLEVPVQAPDRPLENPPRRENPDDLLEGYLETAFYGNDAVSLFGTANRDTLEFAEQQIYDALKRWFQDVAAGRESSSDIIVHLTLSASQLGIPSVSTLYDGTPGPSEALLNRLDEIDNNRRMIFDAVSDDSPYDTYWIDSGRSWWYSRIRVEELYADAGLVKFCCRWQFPVSAHYADAEALTEHGYFRTDLEKTGRNGMAAQAGENARRLVEQKQGLDDLAKLEAYKHYICTQVSYDHQAAQDLPNDVNGSGPWEVINVFDEDPSTNVVCAGYGKAFQYLCDLSEFQADITCYQATGDMVDSGPHLWNIVDVDGVQLLADITCVDQDYGEENACFLTTVVPKDGGYAVYRNGATWIYYKDERFLPAQTRQLVSEIFFRMPEPYAGGEAPTELQTQDGRVLVNWTPALKDGRFASNTAYAAELTLIPTAAPFLENVTVKVNGTQLAVYASDAGLRKTCRISFPETGTLEGWVQVGGGMKYRDADGNELRNTWADIDGNRYHFDDQGFRQTGFLTENGKTYYLDIAGRMTTGWQNVDGQRYYFNEDGTMARSTWVGDAYVGADGALDPEKIRNAFRDEPGGRRYYDHNGEPVKDQWKEIAGKRYRFDAQGYLMRSCWFDDGDLRCYLDAEGLQVDGWQEIEGKTYYFRNGWLVRDTWVDDNRYVDENGVLQPPRDHWVLVEVGESPEDWRYRYLHADGTWTVNGWEEIEGERYHFDSQGFLEEEWHFIDGEWYYLTRSGLWKDSLLNISR